MSRVGELVGDFNINPIKNESTLHILGGDARKLIAHHNQPWLIWLGLIYSAPAKQATETPVLSIQLPAGTYNLPINARIMITRRINPRPPLG